MQKLKTKDYSIFKFREDNRAKIDNTHVERLVKSIQTHNLLEMRPIIVNKEMEVIDGQHRLLAAERLGVEIFYEVKEDLKTQDVILMNVSKPWTNHDYLNYYVKNEYEEYKKLQYFMVRNNLNLKVALNFIMGSSRTEIEKFKKGEMIFKNDITQEQFDICWETIRYIKKCLGYAIYTESSRFWSALVKLVKHGDFDEKRWMVNLSKMISRIGPRVSSKDYMKMLQDIYNWRSSLKVDLKD